MKTYSVREVAHYTGIPESAINTLLVCNVLESEQSPKGEIFITQEQLDKFIGVKK